ncbi:MAG TPA: glycosyl-4,4'-diaponeurosporenoate acyltransferase [Clostridia bacterium]|nr:glycosyl-4,4'-diaponeurosporenoate acyltransferase [Clostridia bacterium]
MKIIRFLVQRELLLNLLTFFIFSVVITYLSNKMPDHLYSSNSWLLRHRKWEKRGDFYQRIFRVKLWKRLLPELGDIVKSVFPKKRIKEYTREYLQKYIFESCKSELTHWSIIFSAFLFFLWRDFEPAMMIVLLAIILNLPYIIIQRYNRPRIMDMIESLEDRRERIPAV